MRKICLLAFSLFLVSAIYSYAQNPVYQSYNWDPNPKLHTLANPDIPELILKESYITEFAFDKEELVTYYLTHKIIKVNSSDAISKNNRIYLPMPEQSKILIQKARVINSKGEVKELADSDIKTGVNDENKTPYRYFALEGLDKGSEIEYIMAIQQSPSYYGKMQILQGEVPKRNVSFRIISPSNLIFKVKTYNGLPDAVDTTEDSKNILTVSIDSVAGLKEEPFATYTPHLMQLVYKLDENTNTNRKNIINYIDASQRIYELTHEQPEKSTTKDLEKILKQIKLNDKDSLAGKILAIENYVKMNFLVDENSPNVYTDLPKILEYKTTNEQGITKVFAALFDMLNIDYQVVLTTNRFNEKFDPKFEAYNFLDSYLLYFPDLDKYLAPGAFAHRLGCVPYALTYNYGLFVKTVNMGNFKSGLGEVKFINPTDAESTQHNHYATIDFSKSMDDPEITYKIMYSGYYAQPLQPYYSYLPEDRIKEMNDMILKNILADAKFTDIEVENTGAENFMLKPMIIHTKCTGANIVEQAGNKYLVKIGELIGPQVEMYQEEERHFDVENDFNRAYHREIKFDIPAGYKVANPDVMKMDITMKEGEQPISYFKSDYKIKDGKTVIVKANEIYNSIYYPKDRFPEYRAVVNAAADFNKIVVILEKK